MTNPGVRGLLFALLLLSLFQTPARSTLFGPEVDDEDDFNYVEGSGKGPDDWWHLKESWRACKHGKQQSPINLTDENAAPDLALKPLETFYKRSHAILKNRGHDIMLKWPDGGGHLHLDGVKYKLEQCHWHSPAEHHMNGQRPDLEMQMIHQTADDKLAVVGILYNINSSTPDPFLAKLMDPLKYLASKKKKHVRVAKVTPDMVNGPEPYYRYMGSLTTPRCTEGAIWTVLNEVRSVSQEQVQLLRDAVHDGMQNNARSLQPINGRSIGQYQPLTQAWHPSS